VVRSSTRRHRARPLFAVRVIFEAVGTEDRLHVLDDNLGVASMACHESSACCAGRGHWILSRPRSYRPLFHCPFRLVQWAAAVKCRGGSTVMAVIAGGGLVGQPDGGKANESDLVAGRNRAAEALRWAAERLVPGSASQAAWRVDCFLSETDCVSGTRGDGHRQSGGHPQSRQRSRLLQGGTGVHRV
jgi:hypothetical protein